MAANVLSELHLLSSTHYDSRTLLSVILAGDTLLQTKPRRDELLPLGSRMSELVQILCEHAAGNYRVLSTMAAELLAVATKEEITRLDEALYLRVFEPPWSKSRKRA